MEIDSQASATSGNGWPGHACRPLRQSWSRRRGGGAGREEEQEERRRGGGGRGKGRGGRTLKIKWEKSCPGLLLKGGALGDHGMGLGLGWWVRDPL